MTQPASSKGVRFRATVGLLASSILAAAFFWWFFSEKRAGSNWTGPGLAAPLLPLVYFLTELIFGRSVPDLGRSWDELKGWQRGVLGCTVIGGIVAVGIVILTIWLSKQ